MNYIKTKGGGLIHTSCFEKSEQEFLELFPDYIKRFMFLGDDIDLCNEQLKELYSKNAVVKTDKPKGKKKQDPTEDVDSYSTMEEAQTTQE